MVLGIPAPRTNVGGGLLQAGRSNNSMNVSLTPLYEGFWLLMEIFEVVDFAIFM